MQKDGYAGTRASSWTPLHHESSTAVSCDEGSRSSGRISFWAASEFVTFRFARSQDSFCPARTARLPRRSVSVTFAENSKFPPGLTLLPLQASSHSRSLPGERGRVFGGCL